MKINKKRLKKIFDDISKMTDEELSEAVRSIIIKSGAVSMKDMGKVMGMASKELAGKADGKDIAEKVKSFLQ